MDPEYARRYRELHERHWWWRAREAWVLCALNRLDTGTPDPRILDVGCGDGLMFERLAALGRVEGVEPWIRVSDDRKHLKIHACPIAEFRPEHPFDVILMLDVVEHLDDPVSDLRHVRHLLAPGGTLLVTVPAFRALWTGHDDINHHRTRYTRGSFAELATAAGLRVRDSRYFFHWSAPAKLLVRVREHFDDRPPEPATVPPPLINRALLALSLTEQRLLGSLPIPFGSSLMALCQKRD